MNKQVERRVKEKLLVAIEAANLALGGGDAHDLIDALDMAHASMVNALLYIQELEAGIDRCYELAMNVREHIKNARAISENISEKLSGSCYGNAESTEGV